LKTKGNKASRTVQNATFAQLTPIEVFLVCLQDLRNVNPGHEQVILEFSEVVIVYTLLPLPGILYVLMGGNSARCKSYSRTLLFAHSLKFTIYGISAGADFKSSEILECLFVYLLIIGIVSLFRFDVSDCLMGSLRFSYTSQFIILSANILLPNLPFCALANKVFNLPLLISASISPRRPSSIMVLPVGTM